MSGSTWPNVYSVVGSADALQSLYDIQDFRTEDHGVELLDDGTVAVTAYATATAADEASQRGVTVTLVITGDALKQRIEDDIANRGGGGVA